MTDIEWIFLKIKNILKHTDNNRECILKRIYK